MVWWGDSIIILANTLHETSVMVIVNQITPRKMFSVASVERNQGVTSIWSSLLGNPDYLNIYLYKRYVRFHNQKLTFAICMSSNNIFMSLNYFFFMQQTVCGVCIMFKMLIVCCHTMHWVFSTTTQNSSIYHKMHIFSPQMK